MNAVRFHKTGGAEVRVSRRVPDATPGDGQALIRIDAESKENPA